MINPTDREGILAMFINGSNVGPVLATFPGVGRTTIYQLRKEAKLLALAAGIPATNSVVGIIGDTHLPFEHPRYLEFVLDTFDEHNVDTVVHIGDWFDNHAMSFHTSDPDGESAGDELMRAQDSAQDWYDAFPSLWWMSGNHDNIPLRRVRAAGLSKRILRANITGAPEGWKNREYVIIDDVRYSHGIGSAGVMGHLNLSKAKGMSVVMGHCHSFGGVNYRANDNEILFGMNVGCGIDIEAYAMEYAKDFPQRPTLGCGIVKGSDSATFIPMNMGRYSRHVK